MSGPTWSAPGAGSASAACSAAWSCWVPTRRRSRCAGIRSCSIPMRAPIRCRCARAMRGNSAAPAGGRACAFGRGQVRGTTLPARRLRWRAAREGDADRAGEVLFHAHFAEGRNLADVEVLVEAGLAAGLAEDRLRAFLAGDE